MKATLKSALLFACLMMGLQGIQAQTPTQVIIANGGPGGSGNMVRMASWNLGTGEYSVFDSIPASGAASIFIWGRDAYVCADSFLVRYNLDTYQREAMAMIHGLRRVAVWEDKVLVTKGLGSISDHFEVRYAENLYHCFSEPAITGNCEGVVVVGDSGYVANPVSFLNTTGNMAVIDMAGRKLSHNMSLDTMGKFIDNLFLYNGKVVSVNKVKFNNPQWGFISIYDPAGGSFIHHKVDVALRQGTGIDNGLLYASFNGNVGSFDLTTGLIVDSSIVAGQWATSVLDTVNDRIFLTDTDHATYGWVYGFDYNGNPVDTLEVGVSPDAIAVDYNVTVGRPVQSFTEARIQTYPEPFDDVLHVDARSLHSPVKGIVVYDLAGRMISEQSAAGNGILSLTFPDLPSGLYLLHVQTKTETVMVKVTKTNR